MEKQVVHAAEPQEEEEEADLVDPQDTLREECRGSQHCTSLGDRLQECNDRVNSRTKTEETCMEELYDFVHCVDHCISKTLFTHLK